MHFTDRATKLRVMMALDAGAADGKRRCMAGVGKLLKQAAKMQKKLEAVQAELAEKTIDVSSGGGAVTVTITLQQEVRAVKFDPEFLKEDAEVVEEAVTEAMREAVAKSKQLNEEAVAEVTQSMQMPGLPGLF